MKAFQYIFEKTKEQDGAAAVIVALLMVALIGMSALVIDLGNSYVSASKLQSALDSAALAAVQELPAADTADPSWQYAKTVGSEYAAANGLDNATFEPIVKNGKIRGVKAAGSIEVTYTFARVIGFESGQISRTASAEAQTVDGMIGLVPMAATVESMEALLAGSDDMVYLKGGPQDKVFFGDSGGWRGFWSINKGDFNVNGYTQMVRVGDDPVKTYPGVNTSATDDIYNNHVSGHESCTLENYQTECPAAPNCPRVIVVPIVQELSNSDLAVRGFASFFLETAAFESGQIKTITAKYIDKYVVPGSASGGAASDYGVYVWKLTE